MKYVNLATAAGLAVALSFSAASAADISGAGATFPYPVYAKWADAYKAETGNSVNYQSIGSGGGIKQIQARTVTFGATDAPLSGEELEKSGLVQFPMVMGGIVPIVNIEGITSGNLVLDGQTLGDIFLGKITKWDDPALAALNPGVTLPSNAIAVVHRSDGSGTSFNFTTYLSGVNADWQANVGAASAVEWPVGIGAKGNEGVAANVAQTRNSIGYVEYAYAKQNDMTTANMVNRDGKVVSPTSAAFAAAAVNADWKGTPGYAVILANEPGAESWPMTAATFILVYKQPADPAATAEALKFFHWAYANGDQMADELAYIPMPDAVVSDVEAMWAAEIVGPDGKPLFAGS